MILDDAFHPRLDILPPPQRRLWDELAAIPRAFVLYGGTALALWLGHRQSADFDFFGSETFTPQHLIGSLPLLGHGDHHAAGAKYAQRGGRS